MQNLKTKKDENYKVLQILLKPTLSGHDIIFVCIDSKTYEPKEISIKDILWVGK